MKRKLKIKSQKLKINHECLERLAYYNKGVLKDAEQFNIATTENDNKSNYGLLFLDAVGRVFYRSYLLVFFSCYFLIACLGFAFRLLIKLCTRVTELRMPFNASDKINSSKSMILKT